MEYSPVMPRKIWISGVLALLLFAAAAVRGFQLESTGPDLIHVGLALAATTLLCFSQLWFALYLPLTGRLLRRTLGDGGWREPLLVASRLQRRVLPLALASVAGALGVMALGAWIPVSPTAARFHPVVFWITLAIALAALWVEHTVARDHERMLREVDARVGDAPAV